MKTSIMIALAISISANFANAKPCSLNDAKLINDGLKARAADANQSPETRESASFVKTLIENDPSLKCSMELGIAGNTYKLVTSTHDVLINFFGSDISQVLVKRASFSIN